MSFVKEVCFASVRLLENISYMLAQLSIPDRPEDKPKAAIYAYPFSQRKRQYSRPSD